jgi:hypothetical protein
MAVTTRYCSPGFLASTTDPTQVDPMDSANPRRLYALAFIVLGLASLGAEDGRLTRALATEAAHLSSVLDEAVTVERAAAEFHKASCLESAHELAQAVEAVLTKKRESLDRSLESGSRDDRADALGVVETLTRILGDSARDAGRCYEPTSPAHHSPRSGVVTRVAVHADGTVLQVTNPAQFDEPLSFGPPMTHYLRAVRGS